MFPGRPPFSYARIREVVHYRSLDFVPEGFFQRTVPIVNEHSLSVSGKPGKERAEPKLVRSIKVLKGLHPAQEHLCELTDLLPGLHQVPPLRSQDINTGATALLVLVPYLNRKVNERWDDANGSDHLSDRGKHFPVHVRLGLAADGVDVRNETRMEANMLGFAPPAVAARRSEQGFQ